MTVASTAPVQRSSEEQTSSAAPSSKGSTTPSSRGSGMHVQLRSLPFAEQMAMLSPSEAPVQRKGGEDTAGVHEAAAQGIAGGGSGLAHGGAIQAAFGRHDVSDIQMHTGAAADQATSAMGASAYATGNHVVLGGGGQDLHTVAHEAAHVVQQRAGVSLNGGVGQSGDRYEQHADAVADAVVQGKSAEGLLDGMAGGASSGGGATQMRAVQRDGNDGTYVNQDNVGETTTQGVSPDGVTASVSTANGGTIAAGREWTIWSNTPPIPPAPIGTTGLFATLNAEVKASVGAQIQGLTGDTERQYSAAITGSVMFGIEAGAPPAASMYLRMGPVVQAQAQATFDSEGLKSVEGAITLDSVISVGVQAGGGAVDYSVELARANIGRFVGFRYTRGANPTTVYGTFEPGAALTQAIEWGNAAMERANQAYEAVAAPVRRMGTAISDAWSWLTE